MMITKVLEVCYLCGIAGYLTFKPRYPFRPKAGSLTGSELGGWQRMEHVINSTTFVLSKQCSNQSVTIGGIAGYLTFEPHYPFRPKVDR